jgi:transcriptional regulator
MRAFVAEQAFGALFLVTPEGPRVAHTPVVFLDDTHVGFHLSRANALAAHLDGARTLFVAQGPHGYISPDWYGVDDQVPTWNYVTVELEGIVRQTDEAGLLAIVDALSDAHERRLAPKPVWTRDKMTPGLAEKMAGAITGYTLEIDQWRGTCKLGQNKTPEVRLRAAGAAEAAGHAALAGLMRSTTA